jgi:hypothetical protein
MSSPSRSIHNSDVVTNNSDTNTSDLPIARPPKRPNPPTKPTVEASPDVHTHQSAMKLQAPVKPLPRSTKAATIAKTSKPASATAVTTTTTTATTPIEVDRSRPIPAPSEPKQFRAIGLIRGKYVPSEEQFTCGTFFSDDGAEIDSVLLGRVMSLIKKHINLEESHLWVVYPRTQQESGSLHLQIVGVWEPETLAQEEEETDSDDKQIASSDVEDDNYFSIRGEVVFYSEERSCTVVKIRQAPRKKGDTARYFKLSLNGKIEGRTLGHFWDFHVRRNGTMLAIEHGECVGPMPPKRNAKRNPGRKPFRKKFDREDRNSQDATKPTGHDRDTPKPQLRSKTESDVASTVAE